MHSSLGSSLPAVNAYEDLFLFRDPAHPWMIDSRPEAATNTHDLRIQSGLPTFTPTTTFGTARSDRRNRRSVRWYVHTYLHTPDSDMLPIDETQLSNLSVGGARNYGYGRLEYVDSQVVDLDDLDYSWLEDTDQFSIELIAPYITSSEYPGVPDKDVPWWEPMPKRFELVTRSSSNEVSPTNSI